MRRFSTGEPVVYEEVQQPTNAQIRQSAQLADSDDSGVVYHFMTVMESREKGTLVLLTQSGKLHVTHNNNPNLRRASWWERLRYPNRFPRIKVTTG